MPTSTGKPYTVDWRGRPPHMLDQDVPVWYRWLDKYKAIVQTLYYDVLLGGPFLTPEQLKDPFLKMWRDNTAKRADAIVETTDQVLIIEVATYPGIRTLGQLATYQTLWLEDPKINKPEILLIVAARIDEDLGAAAAKFGVQIYLI